MPNDRQMERINQLVSVLDRSFDTDNVLGYHGTSIEVLQYLIEHGRFAGMTARTDTYYKKGDLYFYPRLQALPKKFQKLYERKRHSDDDRIQGAMVYAKMLAADHAFAAQVGWPMGDDRFSLICLSSWVTSLFKLSRVRQKRNWTRAEQHEYQELMEFRRTCRLDKAAFLSAALTAVKRKGVILALDKKILRHHSIHPGDDFKPPFIMHSEPGDLFIRGGKGLDYKFICGIKLLGSEEESFMAHLKLVSALS